MSNIKRPTLSNFVRKLYYILTASSPTQLYSASQSHTQSQSQLIQSEEQMTAGQYQHIIRWTADGKGFQIVNENQFAHSVLAKFYRHSNMPSFIRQSFQLNMYGFRKIKNQSIQYYMHPLFLRDRPELSHQICRKPQRKLLESNQHHFILSQRDQNKQNEPIQDSFQVLLKQSKIQQKERSRKNIKKVRFTVVETQVTQSLGLALSHSPLNKRKKRSKLNSNISSSKQSKKSQSILSQSRSSLANLLNRKSEATIFNNEQFGDHVSICENIEDRQNEIEMASIKSKIIYWTPSQILSRNGIEDKQNLTITK